MKSTTPKIRQAPQNRSPERRNRKKDGGQRKDDRQSIDDQNGLAVCEPQPQQPVMQMAFTSFALMGQLMQSSAKDSSDCVGQGNAENDTVCLYDTKVACFRPYKDNCDVNLRTAIPYPQKNRGRIEVEGQKAQQTRDQKKIIQMTVATSI